MFLNMLQEDFGLIPLEVDYISPITSLSAENCTRTTVASAKKMCRKLFDRASSPVG
jgi:hypothetical protein